MEHVYASLDIGSDSIKVVVTELHQGHLNLLAATSEPSKGVKKGLIVEPKLAKESIIRALKGAEAMLGVRIKKVIATVPSHFAKYRIIKGECVVEGDLITSKDMVNSYKDGIKKHISPNEEFVTVIPIDFKINGKTVMKDPKNFPGQSLVGRAMMVTVPKKNVYSIASIVESIGIELVDITVSSIGDTSAFITEELKTGLGAIINIGGDMTTVSIFNKGVPAAERIIGAGGKDIDKDISYKYRISVTDAREIKESFALASTKGASKENYYEVQNIENKPVKISQFDVSKIAASRLKDILEAAKNELEDLTNKQIKYIIVTGGISNMLNFDKILNDVLITAKKGNVKLIGIRNNKYSVAIGNIIYFLNTLKLKGMDYSMFSEEDMDLLSSQVSDNDETVLGKVFSYFFGE